MKSNLSSITTFPVSVRLGIFVLGLLALWLPIAGPIYWIWGPTDIATVITLLLLYGEFIYLLRFWGQRVYQRSRPLKYYGLQLTSGNLKTVLIGLSLGLISLLSLFGIEAGLGWLTWRESTALPHVILEGLVVALAFGFAEELLFRGWLLDELEQDYRPQAALWICSILYALLHFIKPIEAILQSWPQFFGLLLLGLTLVWAKRLCRGHLGLAIGLHAGFVWGIYIINVADIVSYTNRVPVWITGINQNPLSGLTGLLFLGCIAFGFKRLNQARMREAINRKVE